MSHCYRPVRHVLHYKVLVLIFAVVLGPGVPQAEPEVRETHKDWTVVCDTPEQFDREICLIVQQKNMKDSNEPVIRIEIGYAPQTSDPLLLATVSTSLGLTLAHGLEMQIDESEPLRFAYGSCIAAGCIVAANINDEQIASLKRGSEAHFTFQDTRGRRITVPISLSGFTAAFSAVGS
jgi:invasion protein IalB